MCNLTGGVQRQLLNNKLYTLAEVSAAISAAISVAIPVPISVPISVAVYQQYQ
jgi:hypothetical protein